RAEKYGFHVSAMALTAAISLDEVTQMLRRVRRHRGRPRSRLLDRPQAREIRMDVGQRPIADLLRRPARHHTPGLANLAPELGDAQTAASQIGAVGALAALPMTHGTKCRRLLPESFPGPGIARRRGTSGCRGLRRTGVLRRGCV